MSGLAMMAVPALAQDRNEVPFSDPLQDVFNDIAFSARDAGITAEIGIAVRTGEESHRLLFTSPDRTGRWPWASVTRQVIATMVMQQVERGRIQLDAPLIAYLPLPAGGDTPSPTVRQLLQHRSGLRNPETPGDDGRRFYQSGLSRPAAAQWCLTGRVAPPSKGWSRNTCDYIVLGTLLEAKTGEPIEQLIADYIALPAAMKATRLADVRDRPTGDMPEGLAGHGTSAALVGSAEDMLRFSLALMEGRLLGHDARSAMWAADPAPGSMALGQWSYLARLEGCDTPQRIIEQRGGIGRFQALHLMLPGKVRSLVLLGPAPDMDLGAIRAGEGLAYELISKLACEDLE